MPASPPLPALQADLWIEFLLRQRAFRHTFKHYPLFIALCFVSFVGRHQVADASFFNIRSDFLREEHNQQKLELRLGPWVVSVGYRSLMPLLFVET